MKIASYMKERMEEILSPRTVKLIRFDLMRLRTRLSSNGLSTPKNEKLHFGCGSHHVSDWLNVDVRGSDWDVDLASGKLPWTDDCFDAAVGRHVIEHLELKRELVPLFEELCRVIQPRGTVWVSCPDIERICNSYRRSGLSDLVQDRQKRFPEFNLDGVPDVHMMNILFHQNGEHRNLFDFDLLKWALTKAGFEQAERVSESDLLQRYPEFSKRDDDYQSLYVRAAVPSV